jgi:endoglucanase
MEYASLLALLSETMSVSGQEHTAQSVLKTHLAPYFDEISFDAIGNGIFVRRGGAQNAKKLLLDAHFDEIGMMVSSLEDGFVRVCAVGGLDLRTLQATPVILYGKEPIFAVVSSTPPHLQSGKGDKLPKVDELLIDTGLSLSQMEEKGIGIGTPIGFATPFHSLQNGRLCGRSLDNKACCAAALLAVATANILPDWDIYVLLSAKEEIGGGCARTAAGKIAPNLAIVLDGNIGKVECAPSRETVVLGEGVSISISAVTDRTWTRFLCELANDAGIAHQRIVEASSTGTNADLLALAENGIRCAVISIPLRHMHTPCEVIASADASSMIDLLKEVIERGLSQWNLP